VWRVSSGIPRRRGGGCRPLNHASPNLVRLVWRRDGRRGTGERAELIGAHTPGTEWPRQRDAKCLFRTWENLQVSNAIFRSSTLLLQPVKNPSSPSAARGLSLVSPAAACPR